MGVERIAAERELPVSWVPFPLHPETPAEGRELEDLFAGRGVDVARMLEHLRGVAQTLGLPWGDRRKTFNSRLAQELGVWAERQGRGQAFRAAVYQAYFADGRNIGQPEELLKVAAGAGLQRDAAREVLERRSCRGEVDGAWARARRAGVTAVPTHVFRGQTAPGFLPYERLAEFLDQA